MSFTDATPRDSAADAEAEVTAREKLVERTSAGVFIVGSRGLALLVLALAGNVVLARLLTPRDFGIVAIGMGVTLVSGLLSDGGLGAALIRRAEPPDRDELGGLTALQLTVTVALAAAAAAVAAVVGGPAWVVAAMAASMPLVAFQFAGRILLERSLDYRPLAVVEVAQGLTYHIGAIALVVAGLGVWGVALAVLLRTAVATALMARASPVGIVWPRFSWDRVRPLIGFGVRFQAVTATWVLREQLLNAAIGLIAGFSTLGLWRLAGRLMEVPFLLLQSLWRVSFPAMSQFVTTREAPAPLIERAAGMAVVGTGTLLTALAGSAPGLIPGLFGETWHDAAAIIPGACLGLAVGGSVSVATQGYLYAVGDASAVLRSVVLQALAWFAVTLPLLRPVGPAAIGLGWTVSSFVEATVLARATAVWTPVRLARVLGAPLVVGTASAAGGWLLAEAAGANLASGVAGGALAVACFQAGLFCFRRDLLRETASFAIRAMRAATARRDTTATD